MHIEPTTHEQVTTAKVYVYEGDYEVRDTAITWQAQTVCGEETARALSGRIPLSSPGVAAVAEQAVRDAIVHQIDGLAGRDTSRV
jgi:hypothetical protein